ncbi:amyloid fiber anchoring/assembly protein TapA [Gracilibacillus kekensis]|uniref:YqxM protein n=1 Tax=Gracilibacillus kekensis TaxID=1027249 RepID=A0A1M7MYW1_9BACI|nr:amyloid fiber anchoring/assembly protein TapA [Gracilibacillus kekensis]SHM96251.1 YqxM protein [Gracilibacillus kekensis]
MKYITTLKRMIKRKHLNLAISILIFGVLGLSFLATYTDAKFFNTSGDTFKIQSGTWWDGSDLSFTQEPEQDMNACPALHISFQLKNTGFTMLDTTAYQLYYSSEDEPSEGEIVKEGSLPIISENGTYSLDTEVNSEGKYQLKVDQRPMYQDDEETQHSIWSEAISVICEEEEEEETNDEKVEIEEKDKTSEPQNEEESLEKEEVIEEEKDPSGKEDEENENKQNDEETDEQSIEEPVKEEDKQVEDDNAEAESTIENVKEQTVKEGEQDGDSIPEGTEKQEEDLEKNKESDQ